MIEQVAKEHQQTLAPLVDELELFNSGLDSLSLAVIVVRLEDELMVDPFSGSDATGVPKTVGDFVRAYERAVERAAAETAQDLNYAKLPQLRPKTGIVFSKQVLLVNLQRLLSARGSSLVGTKQRRSQYQKRQRLGS